MAEIIGGPEAISIGVDRLSKGELVCFPTETVYGLGADALNPDAVAKVYALKGRPSNNPLIVHVSGIEMCKEIVSAWPAQAEQIAKAFWPGPMTIVLPKAKHVPDIVCAGGSTVAIRCPEHPCALALIEAFGKPIVGPSANPSGRISPTTPEHVLDGFADSDLMIVDGGHCRAGIESTVVDLSSDRVRVLRPGIIGAHRIAELIGRPVECVTQVQDGTEIRSPGLVGAHYQPTKPTKLVDSDKLSKAHRGVVLVSWSQRTHPEDGVLILIEQAMDRYAAQIYGSLHQADESAGEEIWIEQPPQALNDDTMAIRRAVMERLGRATQSH